MLRFAANGNKIEKNVEFNHELDLSPFCVGDAYPLVELLGMIVHSGHQIHRGHFVCNVMCTNGLWYSVDDGRVVKVTAKSVLATAPYILFFKRKVPRIERPVWVTFGCEDEDDQPAEEVVRPPATYVVWSPYHQ
jgi:ubiquitin carboxyl-terminal hydrolase 36/42